MSKQRGKNICETLRSVRERIAKAGGIAYHPRECHHEGECSGNCPACDTEMKYLEQSLIRKFGDNYAHKFIGVAMMSGAFTLSSCQQKSNSQTSGSSSEQTTQMDSLAEVKDSADCIDMPLQGEAPALNDEEVDSLLREQK